MPELPEIIKDRLRNNYKLPQEYLDVLTKDKFTLDFAEKAFRQALKKKVDVRTVASAIVNQKADIKSILPEKFIEDLLDMKREVVSDKGTLDLWVQEAISQSPQAVNDYQRGKLEALAPVIGKVMQLSKGKANPVLVKKILEAKLKN